MKSEWSKPKFYPRPKTKKKIKRSILTTVCNIWAERKGNNREQWPGKKSHYYYLGFGFTTLNPKALSMHLIIDYQGGVNTECKKENPGPLSTIHLKNVPIC